MDGSDLIAVGEIVKCQGIKGEVKVLPFTDDPRRFAELKRVFLKSLSGVRELQVEGYRPFRQFVLVKFKGIDDLNAAEALGRGLLCIPRDERPKLPPGRYYLDEIEGLSVFTTAGEWLGRIEQVIQTGANDVYLVRNRDRKEVLIPALKTVVREIDLGQSKMLVDLPEGLLDE